MSKSIINSQNIYQVVEFMIRLDKFAFEKEFQQEAQILIESMQAAWNAYTLTKTSFGHGESIINIVDHYLNALVEIARALYEIINQNTKQQLINHLAKESGK